MKPGGGETRSSATLPKPGREAWAEVCEIHGWPDYEADRVGYRLGLKFILGRPVMFESHLKQEDYDALLHFARRYDSGDLAEPPSFTAFRKRLREVA